MKSQSPVFAMCVLMLTLVMFGATPALSDDKTPRRIISLTGTGEVKAVPDLAHVSSGVVTQAETANAALVQNSAAMRAVFTALKQAGIAEKDIQTSNFTVQPQYFYDTKNKRRPPEIIGYRVSNQVAVTVRNLKSLGGVLDMMVRVGANRLSGISFSVSNPDDLLNAARKRAMANAIAKAKLYTQSAGIQLGDILTINEASTYTPQPRRFARAARMRAAAPVPVAAGQQSLSVRVNVTWALH